MAKKKAAGEVSQTWVVEAALEDVDRWIARYDHRSAGGAGLRGQLVDLLRHSVRPALLVALGQPIPEPEDEPEVIDEKEVIDEPVLDEEPGLEEFGVFPDEEEEEWLELMEEDDDAEEEAPF